MTAAFFITISLLFVQSMFLSFFIHDYNILLKRLKNYEAKIALLELKEKENVENTI